MTNCERCCSEIEDDAVEYCEICGDDGLCNDCLMDHECISDKVSEENREID